jgi:ribonuclease P protein component
MFKKINRVSSRLFKTLIKEKTYFSVSFRVKCKSKQEVMKVSVVIPKKIVKKRIMRNSLKRKIIHYIQQTIDCEKTPHCVFWLTKNIKNTEKTAWQQEIDNHMKTLGIKNH